MSTSSKSAVLPVALYRRLAFVALLALLLTSCGKKESETTASSTPAAKPWNQSDAESEYRLIKAELSLAEAKKPYLVLNFPRKYVELRLNGVLVWEFPMELIETDQSDLKDFSHDFLGPKGTLMRPILEKHLFASQGLTPDSVLAIISEATNVNAELLQRELPSRFQLLWAGGLTLDVRTDVEGKPKSKFQNTLADIKQAITRPLGREVIILKMPRESALTLYRATLPGLPTLIIPA